MLIYITFLMAVDLYLCSMFLKNRRRLGMFIFGVLFVLSIIGVTANYSHHWGMKQVTTTKSQKIYSAAGSNMPINLYQPVGTSGEDNVYIYKTSPNQKKPQHTQANELTHSITKATNDPQARLLTKETRWQYQNGFYQFLFMGTGMNNKLVRRTNTLYYPKGYVKLTAKQAKRLRAVMASQGQAAAALQQQVTTTVQQKVAAAHTQDPQKIKQITQQAQIQVQGQLIQKALQK